MRPNFHDALDRMAYWTLPPGVRKLLGHASRRLNGKNERHSDNHVADLATANSAFKNRHAGERCFVLATGPSVAHQDLTVLAGELCIAVSHFFLHKDIKTIAPRYHVEAPYHHPFTNSALDTLFRGYREHYTRDVTYFFGHYPYEYSIYNYLAGHPDERPPKCFYIDYSHSPALDEHNYLTAAVWDIASAPYRPRTVVYTAIQLALYMGCKTVHLVGCDHDYLLDMKRTTNHHFYREEDGVNDEEHLAAFTTERWFEEYYFRWKQYRLMRDYANRQGCEIINATMGGMLDVFRRVSLEQILVTSDAAE